MFVRVLVLVSSTTQVLYYRCRLNIENTTTAVLLYYQTLLLLYTTEYLCTAANTVMCACVVCGQFALWGNPFPVPYDMMMMMQKFKNSEKGGSIYQQDHTSSGRHSDVARPCFSQLPR